MKKKPAIATLAFVALMIAATGCKAKEMPAPVGTGNASMSLEEKKLIAFIQDRRIARAISRSKRPYLYAAIAKQESNYNPRARGTKSEYGLFQIRVDIHGRFGNRLESQVAKAESVLEPLIARYGVRKGVRKYNGMGDRARIYAKDVLRIEKTIRLASVDK